MSSEPQVLVTGAAGSLGRRLVPVLEAAGYRVCRLLRGDALTGDVLRERLTGVTTVFNLAASQSPHADVQRQAHLDLPQALLDQAAAAGVRRFVQFSSVKAIAGEQAPVPLATDSLPAPTSEYGRYKLAAEELVRAHPAAAHLQVLVVRLPMVYGADLGANFLRLSQAVARGLPLPAAADNRRSVLAVDNLQAFLLTLLQREPAPAPGVQTLHLADPDALSTADLLRAIGAALNRPARILPVASAWARRLAAVPLLGGVLARLCGSLELDLASMHRWPDWQPPLTTAAAVRQALSEPRR